MTNCKLLLSAVSARCQHFRLANNKQREREKEKALESTLQNTATQWRTLEKCERTCWMWKRMELNVKEKGSCFKSGKDKQFKSETLERLPCKSQQRLEKVFWKIFQFLRRKFGEMLISGWEKEPVEKVNDEKGEAFMRREKQTKPQRDAGCSMARPLWSAYSSWCWTWCSACWTWFWISKLCVISTRKHDRHNKHDLCSRFGRSAKSAH